MASECLHVNARLEELREIPLNTSSSQTGASNMTVVTLKIPLFRENDERTMSL